MNKAAEFSEQFITAEVLLEHQFSLCSRPVMSYLPAIRDSEVIDGLNVRYLKIFGLWGVINDYRTTGKRNAVIKCEVFITLLFAAPYLFCQCLSYFVIDVDLQKATFLNMHSLSALQICCKMLVFWFRIDKQCRLFNLMRKDFLTKLPEYKRAGVSEIFETIAQKTNMFCLASFVVNASIVMLCVAVPGISVDYIAHHTGSMLAVTGGKKKILGGWYPLPMSESPYYQAIFVYETIVAVWAGILLAVYVCLFFQVLMCLYAQFSVLGYHMSTLKIDSDISCKKDRNNNTHSRNLAIYNEIYAIIQDHQKLLSYANELRRVYNPLVTMVLGMGVFVLIIAVFQFLFGGRGSPMFIFRSLQYVAYQGVEVSMFCFGSSYIEAASSDLQFAIYSSDWYKADTKFRKSAQMVMMRARKGVTLTAIKMYPVNVETIMSIFQFTYSASALLSRMIE